MVAGRWLIVRAAQSEHELALCATIYAAVKLLIFAHIPPPHHGLSYMVKLMLDGFGGDCRAGAKPTGPVQCYHVNARVSDNMEDIGAFRLGKLLLILRYCFEAIWCRFRYGVRALYYVPAPGKRAALYRDWIVMLLCRPFFRQRIYHWHASGLGDWLKTNAIWPERWLTHLLLGHPKLSFSLAIPSMRDALWFQSRGVKIVPNGIPDPCPYFDSGIAPRRLARVIARRAILAGKSSFQTESDLAGEHSDVFRVFYLAHCTREKGVFETIEGVRLANDKLRAKGSRLRIQATIAGAFLFPEEEPEFHAAINEANQEEKCVEYAGFVSGDAKQHFLLESDCLCFPTFYSAEGQPVSLIEAMAFGLQIVTTRWRAIPDMLPADHPGFCIPQSAEDVSAKLLEVCTLDALSLRRHFVEHYTVQQYVEILQRSLSLLDSPSRVE